MMALYDRERTGCGQYIDTAMLNCLFSVFETRLPGYALNGEDIGEVPRYGTGDPLACPSNVYRCKDGYVCLHAGTDPNYRRFSEVTQDSRLMQDKYMKIEERMADYFTVDALTAEWFAGRTVEEADALLTDAGVPCGIVYNLKRILEDPNSTEQEMVVYTEVPGLGQVPFVGSPLKLKTRPIKNRRRAPLIGEDTDDILKNLAGLSDEQLAGLRGKGVI